MADAGGTYANFFDAHPPFQIDGNFGAVSGMTEMLLLSPESYRDDKGHESYILDLLPALPSAWPSGTISSLKAMGAFEISLSWKNHKLSTASIRSLLGSTLRIRSLTPIKINGLPVKSNFAGGYYNYEIDSKKGMIYNILAE